MTLNYFHRLWQISRRLQGSRPDGALPVGCAPSVPFEMVDGVLAGGGRGPSLATDGSCPDLV